MTRKPTQIYQIKVTLDDTHPPVWRRVQVPGSTSLLGLHHVLQEVMGWQDYHLHQFTIADQYYGDPENDEWGELGLMPETRYQLSQVIPGEGFCFHYEYDFGDSWWHTLLVEKIVPAEPGVRYPTCLKGRRACPPEDVGGVWGYESFLEAIRDPRHPEHEEYLEWIGGQFDPEAFDLEAVNARLRRPGRGVGGEPGAWPLEEDQPVENRAALAAGWAQELTEEQRAHAENLPLRRDLITLLTYLRDNRVTGTQATGNLPLKAVREITAGFVNPPKLEDKVGDRVFRVRSEAEVWPLYFRHGLAAVGGLVTGGPGRRWRLTPLGERFLTTPAPLQVWILLDTWWTQTDWAVAWPYGEEGRIPADFPELALSHLLDLPPGDWTPFRPFADRLIEAAGLVWPIQDQETAHWILQAIVRRTVINPLIDFGMLEATYEPDKTLGAEFPQLSTFQITPFGRGLLGLLGRLLT